MLLLSDNIFLTEHAYDILKSLSGKEHTVVTGVCILSPSRPPIQFYESTAVKFTSLSDEVTKNAF